MIGFLLRLLPVWAWGLVLAGILATAGATGWIKGAAHVRAQWEQQRQADLAAINEANMRAAQAGHRYEEWKAAQRPRIITRTVEVERVLQADPVWSSAPLPDGVRQQLEAAAAEFAQPSAH
jgi:hypothetical protein